MERNREKAGRSRKRSWSRKHEKADHSPGILLMEMREQESIRPGKSLRACSIPPFLRCQRLVLTPLPAIAAYLSIANLHLRLNPSTALFLLLSVSNRVVSAYSSNLDDRLFEITAPTESLSAEHGSHPGTEARTAIFFYANGKFFLFLQWTIAAYLGSKFLQLDYSCPPCFANLNGRLFWNHCSYGITCSFTPLDMVGLTTSSYFFYANLKYLALLGTRT